eukprot:1014980_1
MVKQSHFRKVTVIIFITYSLESKTIMILLPVLVAFVCMIRCMPCGRYFPPSALLDVPPRLQKTKSPIVFHLVNTSSFTRYQEHLSANKKDNLIVIGGTELFQIEKEIDSSAKVFHYYDRYDILMEHLVEFTPKAIAGTNGTQISTQDVNDFIGNMIYQLTKLNDDKVFASIIGSTRKQLLYPCQRRLTNIEKRTLKHLNTLYRLVKEKEYDWKNHQLLSNKEVTQIIVHFWESAVRAMFTFSNEMDNLPKYYANITKINQQILFEKKRQGVSRVIDYLDQLLFINRLLSQNGNSKCSHVIILNDRGLMELLCQHFQI